MNTGVLDQSQRKLITDRSARVDSWRNPNDLNRRRRISTELQQAFEKSEILEGKTIDHRTLCEFVALQWQIQNLNPVQMPRFLGLYAYRVHFGSFRGSRDDLLAQRKEETGEEGMYEGADLVVISQALRRMASDRQEEQGIGASQLLEVDGAGQALVSGFLHLLHPATYGLVNAPTRLPFDKDGWLGLTDSQRKHARDLAKALFPTTDQVTPLVLNNVFRWEVLLAEVRDLCGFEDFHELDQFLWTITTEPTEDADDRVKVAVKEIRPQDLEARCGAEKRARHLIERNLGSLTADQLSELFTHLNTCASKKGVVYIRFSPAFLGHNANLLMEQGGELNKWIKNLWSADDTNVAEVLNQFWEKEFSGGGRSLPTAILYLRDPEKYAVWTPNLEKALYSVVNGLPAKIRTGFSYLQYCRGVQQLRRKFDFPMEMHDFVLFKLLKPSPKISDKDDQKKDDQAITIADLAAETYLEENFFETLDLYLRDKRQLVFCGPPGTGKTFVALKYANYLAQSGGQVRLVQFHPSYGYEDFIEGLRPVPAEQGGLCYRIEDGIFKRLCVDAFTSTKTFVLVIDEINRGNIPRIFGELLFLLEHRKKETLLPYSKKPFAIPDNVVVLGTMNSSDRSIALMDLALRRRFHFVEMQPRSEVLLGWLKENSKPLSVRHLFDRLNDGLRKAGVEEDRLIGHSHFMSTYLDDSHLKIIWNGTVVPLLKEYFFAEPEKIAAFSLDKLLATVEEIGTEGAEAEEADDET